MDKGHVEKTVNFDDSTPDERAGRVTESERAPTWRGAKADFIPHSALHSKIRNTEFSQERHFDVSSDKSQTKRFYGIASRGSRPAKQGHRAACLRWVVT